jgi:hypothetical protein
METPLASMLPKIRREGKCAHIMKNIIKKYFSFAPFVCMRVALVKKFAIYQKFPEAGN